MNQTPQIAQDVLKNPPQKLQQLLDDSRTPDSARKAVQELQVSSAASDTAGNKDGPTESSRLQIVNENQEFTKELSPYLAKWDLLDKGFAYDVVAVFGSQSTGKSTLLNRLFGTTFDVMDESKRQQTTKGIWMCPSQYSSTLVMDVEGTDGRERGEDQDFERKSALFSLASTEVLIVNLWEHQIGLYNGANMGLLKTVFEVNLGLFGGGGDNSKPKPQEKTLILFVIRDHVGATPMSNLTDTLTQDMEKIWDSLSKPAHLEDAALSSYFDLSFAALPHKILMPEKFEEAVLELRQRFVDRSREDYVFQPAYHKRIPADGVSFYMEGIWQQVLTNKDLDLPTQQELLAQFRCDEISTLVVEAFLASAKIVRKPVDGGSVVEGLGALMRDWLETALGKFDRDASRYHSAVYQRKRLDLLASLHASLSPLFLGQLKNLHKIETAKFSRDIVAGVKEPGYDFAVVVEEGKKRARERFLTGAKEVMVEETDWEYENELALLDEDLKLIADKCRADETKKMVNAIERNVKRQILEPIEIATSQPTKTMWDIVLKTYSDVMEAAEEAYFSKAKSYNCSDEENAAALTSLRARAWLALRRKLEEQTSDSTVLTTLRTKFEDSFRYDEGGVPRVWKPEDDIEAAFRKAKDETLALLPLFANIAPTEPSLLPELPPPEPSFDLESDPSPFDPSTAFNLLTATKLLSLESRFKRDADAAYVEAKRSMVSSVAQIPVWMYGVLVVLGWNEAMAVLFNPLYFAMLLVLAASGYIILQLGLAGPILQISGTVIREIRQIAAKKLREAFADVPEAQRVLAQPVTASSSDGQERKGDLLKGEMLEK
ncbi:protein SEY1 [Cryptococcus deuterogattii 99/473]|uniref:Protein SEY1 n=2 Tax=Cryptococcus deuterogattii TaxID=1859096 RepID=A0A0D0UXM3_9TREE|nr:protein SEY1 [Cryptococcus deuterogattii R265]KIR36510.1 protein SEY1 [Cryptococcus deuterogattii MMRL2647]KIR38914.1 protein SEY1 [Cryptococcus deuterogattii Ram5]KIR75941.1 protein SEY1 [Cryptococcus deuterogattii CA1014]KIS02379.1 protein SEY1 [Cryptococcus deuterogattii 2001/935-1]KIY58826.1 protein SEY1 [Cryptococcus deuterogattii 99/473]